MSKVVRPRDQGALARPSASRKGSALRAFEQGEVRLCVRVPEPLYRRLKAKLGLEGKNLQQYVITWLEAELSREPLPPRGAKKT